MTDQSAAAAPTTVAPPAPAPTAAPAPASTTAPVAKIVSTVAADAKAAAGFVKKETASAWSTVTAHAYDAIIVAGVLAVLGLALYMGHGIAKHFSSAAEYRQIADELKSANAHLANLERTTGETLGILNAAMKEPATPPAAAVRYRKKTSTGLFGGF